MKRNILYVCLAAVICTLGACSREQKNLFSESAADRLHNAQQNVINTFVGAPQGWQMLYFPTEDAAGYVFLCRFMTNGSVEIAAQNGPCTGGAYKSEVSCWTMDGTQSTILSFNTYNNVFHPMADPLDDGVGYSGDYEFVILKCTPTEIQLKGKKHGAYVKMYPLAEGEDWKAYFDKIKEFEEAIFTDNDGMDFTYCNGDTVYQMTYEEGTFTYTRNGEEFYKGFVITPGALHFYSGMPLRDTTVFAVNFVLDELQTKLYSTDRPEAYFIPNYTPADFFDLRFNQTALWVYTEEDTDEATQAKVNAIKSAVAANGATITRIALERYVVASSAGRPTISYDIYVAYTVEGRLFEGKINMNYKNANGEITLSYKGTDASLATLLARLNADEVVAAKQIAAIFEGTFIPESYTGSLLNMTQMLLRDKTKSTRFIHVIADKENR